MEGKRVLQEGDQIPPFTLQGLDEEGNEITFGPERLQKGKFILYFYPKDNTPGCTTEAVDFNSHLDLFKNTE
jgi:peroxiredoxin Q/BCP